MPSSRIIVRDVSVLTLDDEDHFYYPATVVIEDDVIIHITEGDYRQPQDEVSTVVLAGTDKLLMPGLVDLHFHTSVAKGYNDSLPLWEYLDQIWYPALRALTPETAQTAALYSYVTALKSGTTCVNDMFTMLPSLAAAAAATGIRAVLANDVALPEHRLDTLADNIHNIQTLHGPTNNSRVRVRLGLEWIPLADQALLAAVGAAKRELGVGVHMHLCESLSELADCQARFGADKTPVRLAYEAGLLGPDCVAAHCVHLTDDDISLLAQTGTHVSYNPGSNAKLGNGVARLADLVAAGVNVGLGVDACECHNSTDLFETLKIGSYVQRAVHQDAARGEARQLLRMATRNGARALDLDAGRIEVGSKADVILLDLTKDMMFTPLLKSPKADRQRMLESHLVFGCNGTAVETVIVDGVVVVQDRRVLGVDEDVVRRDMEALFETLVQEMHKQRMDRAKA